MELYFCRHGQTQWNLEGRFQGKEGDSPLLPQSYEEIKALGQRLQEIPFEAVYSSSLKRARETAEGIMAESKHSQPVILTDELREIGLGELEGCLIDRAKADYCDQLDALRYAPDQYDPVAFGGEPYTEMLKRVCDFVLEAVAQAEKGPLLFVGHGASFTGAIQFLAGKPLAGLRKMGGLHNSTVSILETGMPKEELPYRLMMWNNEKQ